MLARCQSRARCQSQGFNEGLGSDGSSCFALLQEVDSEYVMRAIKERLAGEWFKADQLYFTLPNAALLEARGTRVEQEAYTHSGRRIYILDWAKLFPELLRQHFGKPSPPCPTCYDLSRGSPAERRQQAARAVNCNQFAKYPRRFVDCDNFHYLYSMGYRCLECQRQRRNPCKCSSISSRMDCPNHAFLKQTPFWRTMFEWCGSCLTFCN